MTSSYNALLRGSSILKWHYLVSEAPHLVWAGLGGALASVPWYTTAQKYRVCALHASRILKVQSCETVLSRLSTGIAKARSKAPRPSLPPPPVEKLMKFYSAVVSWQMRKMLETASDPHNFKQFTISSWIELGDERAPFETLLCWPIIKLPGAEACANSLVERGCQLHYHRQSILHM